MGIKHLKMYSIQSAHFRNLSSSFQNHINKWNKFKSTLAIAVVAHKNLNSWRKQSIIFLHIGTLFCPLQNFSNYEKPSSHNAKKEQEISWNE